MKTIKYLSTLVIIGFASMMLAGCVSSNMVTDHNVAITAKDAGAYAAISTVCTSQGGPGKMSMHVDRKGTEWVTLAGTISSAVPIKCGNNKTQYFLLKLDPGEYGIYNIAPWMQELKTMTPYFFTVRRGHVTYIGRLVMHWYLPKNHSSSIANLLDPTVGYLAYHMENNSKNDLPVFYKRYPNVSKSLYSVQMTKKGKTISRPFWARAFE